MNFYPSETATDAEMAAAEAMTMDDYLLNHISPEDDYLHRLYRATNTSCCGRAWRRGICRASSCAC